MKKNWFSKYDYLNITTPLSYKNDYFFSTKIGAFLTIIIFLSILFLTIYEIIILYNKTSFTLTSNHYTDLSQAIDFSQTPILFQIANDNGQLIEIDNRLIEVVAYDLEVSVKIEENGTIKKKLKNTKLELENCDKIYSGKSEYSRLNLSRYICIKPGQNLTAYGLMGDINNSFKGIRIYINKCMGADCYSKSIFEDKLHNAKFLVAYLSLSSNIFYLNDDHLKYQIFTNYFSLSTNILKKITFTFNIGRFYLNNNVFYSKIKSFNYIMGNDYTIDVDLDSSNTLINNSSTLAYIGLNYGGSIIESRKEVKSIFEAITFVGNIFNIILTLFKVINSYYSHKILFVDIFRNILFDKEKININIKETIHLNNIINLNVNNNLKKKKNLDISEAFCFNKNTNKVKNSIESLNKKNISSNYINSKEKGLSKNHNSKKNNNLKNKLIYYYLLPSCFVKTKKEFNQILLIKERICKYFSIEKISELIAFKETFEDKCTNSKINNTKLIKIGSKIFDKNNSNDAKDITY